ncbi:MAG: galactose mutarotase [Planctomycetes bacterium]|nr:galactose mutarotase [Planctomycetota bacterium]
MKSRILVVVTGILIVIGSGLKAEDKIVRHGVSTGTQVEKQTRTQVALATPFPKGSAGAKIVKTPFGITKEGRKSTLFTCTNQQGFEIQLTNYCATMVSVLAPDREGKFQNVTLGFSDLKSYLQHSAFFGCVVGRYANRIAKGRFTLDGQQYGLAINNGPNHLHGGMRGFNQAIWNAETMENEQGVGVKFSYFSQDREEGYPGNLRVQVVYSLSSDNAIRIEYTAETDQATVVNLTNHAYWNLRGVESGEPVVDILDHELTLYSDHYLEVDDTLIPTGMLAAVKGSVMDFTTAHRIGERIAVLKQGPNNPRGYDHCFVVRDQKMGLPLAARVKDGVSGRVMEVLTSQPGMQFYTGNFLEGDPLNGGFKQHEAFCLETQHYPDSPNQPDFPTTVLRPGDRYREVTVYRFSVE